MQIKFDEFLKTGTERKVLNENDGLNNDALAKYSAKLDAMFNDINLIHALYDEGYLTKDLGLAKDVELEDFDHRGFTFENIDVLMEFIGRYKKILDFADTVN